MITGKRMYNVSHCEQLCYECSVSQYGDDACCNFKVAVEGPTPFKDEVYSAPRPLTVSAVNPPQLAEELTGRELHIGIMNSLILSDRS